MGYRSDLVIAINKQAFLDTMLRGNMPKILTRAKYVIHENAYYWRLEGYKWYEGYVDVDEVENYLDYLEPNSWGYIRAGEEPDDIELKGDPYVFDIYAGNYVEAPFDR